MPSLVHDAQEGASQTRRHVLWHTEDKKAGCYTSLSKNACNRVLTFNIYGPLWHGVVNTRPFTVLESLDLQLPVCSLSCIDNVLSFPPDRFLGGAVVRGKSEEYRIDYWVS